MRRSAIHRNVAVVSRRSRRAILTLTGWSLRSASSRCLSRRVAPLHPPQPSPPASRWFRFSPTSLSDSHSEGPLARHTRSAGCLHPRRGSPARTGCPGQSSGSRRRTRAWLKHGRRLGVGRLRSFLRCQRTTKETVPQLRAETGKWRMWNGRPAMAGAQKGEWQRAIMANLGRAESGNRREGIEECGSKRSK